MFIVLRLLLCWSIIRCHGSWRQQCAIIRIVVFGICALLFFLNRRQRCRLRFHGGICTSRIVLRFTVRLFLRSSIIQCKQCQPWQRWQHLLPVSARAVPMQAD